MPDPSLYPIYSQSSGGDGPPSTGIKTTVIKGTSGAATALNTSLPAVVGRTNYICGFIVTGGGATAASVITVSMSGPAVTSGYRIAIPAGATLGIVPLVVTFGDNGIAAAGTNTAISIAVASFGVGNTDAAVTIWGYLV